MRREKVLILNINFKLFSPHWKTKQFDEINVEDFVGVVSKYCGYRHNVDHLCDTIIKITQDFTGKNNINILIPIYQFRSKFIYTSCRVLYFFNFPSKEKRDIFLVEIECYNL
jgi:hypothetical protein